MSKPNASQDEFFQSVSGAGKVHVAMHCTKTDATQYWMEDHGTPTFTCCQIVEQFVPAKKKLFQRAFGKPELEMRKFLLTPKPRNPVQWIPDRDCTAIYDPTMEGSEF